MGGNGAEGDYDAEGDYGATLLADISEALRDLAAHDMEVLGISVSPRIAGVIEARFAALGVSGGRVTRLYGVPVFVRDDSPGVEFVARPRAREPPRDD